MISVWVALGAIVAMLAAAAVARFPIWNPTYFFGVLFALQIGAGFAFARQLGVPVPPESSLPLLGAYVLTIALFLGYSLLDRDLVTASPDLREQFRLMRLTPDATRWLVVLLVGIALHNTVVNLILIGRWDTLPILAFQQHRFSVATDLDGPRLPQDVAGPFSVPFFSVVADHLVNPALVIYLVLLCCSKPTAEGTRTMGLGSIPWWVHALFGLVVLNAAIVHRRNPLLVAIATAILVLYLLGRFSKRAIVVGAALLLLGAVALGQMRRGTAELRAAEELGLPAVAGNTMLYEPLVYVGSGVPNFLRYQTGEHSPAQGALLLSSLLPRPVDRALGFDTNRTSMLREMFRDGFVISGQTLRTPWFEAYFDFGWGGVYVLAVLFPTGVHWLYRRAISGPQHGTPSLALFTLAKVVYLFPFISLLFQLPFWTAVAMAFVIDRQLLRSANPSGFERLPTWAGS